MIESRTTRKFGLWLSCSWAIAILCGSVLVTALGCDVGEQLNPAPPDGGTATPLPDAGGDAALRKLVERPLFGQMPLDNRMHDPAFALIDGSTWLPYDPDTESLIRASRVYLARTPLDQPALRVEKEPQQGEAYVLGEAKSTAGAIAVSVWVGRPVGQDPLEDVDVALLGLFLDNEAGAVDLAADAPSEAVTLSDIRWRRVSANIADGPVAFSYLSVATRLDGPLYLTSPILVGAGSGAQARSAHVPARRGLSMAEVKALRAVAAFTRERFHLPDSRHSKSQKSAWR